MSLYKNNSSLQPEAATEGMSVAEARKLIAESQEKVQYWLNVLRTVKILEGAAAITIFAAEFLPAVGEPIYETIASVDWGMMAEMLP